MHYSVIKITATRQEEIARFTNKADATRFSNDLSRDSEKIAYIVQSADYISKSKYITVQDYTDIPSIQINIKSSIDVVDVLRKIYIMDEIPFECQEAFYALYLNQSNKIISYKQISLGGISGTIVEPMHIFKTSIELLARGVIIAHNHPSGNLKPSTQDNTITDNLKKVAKLLDISLVDHIILTSGDYYSYADNGCL